MFSTRELISLKLPPSLREKLLVAGFHTVSDLIGVSPVSLAKEANITREEALSVLCQVPENEAQLGAALAGAKPAKELWEREKQLKRIITFCPEMDKMLGGGVCLREVTEFCGVPGVGKTQLGIQLAIDVQIPRLFGGTGGQAVYIDTEGSFMVDRVVDMADAAVAHVAKLVGKPGSRGHDQRAAAVRAFTRDSVLAGIHYFRVHDVAEQVAVSNSLPEFLDEHPGVQLVVVDSITFHMRQDYSDMSQRTRLLGDLALRMMQLADERELAVVVVNQVTTKITDGASKLVPALGESWAHACTSRVILFWQDGVRCAHLYKSPSRPAATVEYQVTAEGVRGKRAKRRAGGAAAAPGPPALRGGEG